MRGNVNIVKYLVGITGLQLLTEKLLFLHVYCVFRLCNIFQSRENSCVIKESDFGKGQKDFNCEVVI